MRWACFSKVEPIADQHEHQAHDQRQRGQRQHNRIAAPLGEHEDRPSGCEHQAKTEVGHRAGDDPRPAPAAAPSRDESREERIDANTPEWNAQENAEHRGVLVPHAVGLARPGVKNRKRFATHQRDRRYAASSGIQGELLADRLVRKPDRVRVGHRATEIEPVKMRPVNRGQAHRAWLAGGIELAADKMKDAQPGTSVANGDDLGVCGRIARRSDHIGAAADDLASLHDHRAERSAAAGSHAVDGQANGLAHESRGDFRFQMSDFRLGKLLEPTKHYDSAIINLKSEILNLKWLQGWSDLPWYEFLVAVAELLAF